ncbi:hypothetical protein ABZ078_34000 [Streptomyces sp. NPDC006385]
MHPSPLLVVPAALWSTAALVAVIAAMAATAVSYAAALRGRPFPAGPA